MLVILIYKKVLGKYYGIQYLYAMKENDIFTYVVILISILSGIWVGSNFFIG